MDPASKQAAKYKTQSLLGIINDKMEVGMAKIRGEESAALDVAIIKATLQDEVVPKEKHVRTLKIACNGSSPRQTVNYVIHGLAKRLEENSKSWLVTLKTLIVFHRLMRETDPTFQEELLRYAERTGHHRLLRLESFADHTTKETWDYSAWIRVYSLYLDERLSVFRTMRFDPEQDQGVDTRESKLKSCSAAELLDHLPAVQRLLRQLVSCVPEGAAQSNEIALLACSLVLKEVRSVYKVVCEGVLNLVDRIFEMDRGDALKGVELVKENLAVNDRLNAFVGTIGSIPPLRGAAQFPSVQPLPSDFLTTLEEYIKDAPKGAGELGKPSLGRSASTTQRAANTGPRLVVGGPIKDTPSGASSPQPAVSPATPAPQVDLLSGFESFNIGTAPPAAAAPPTPPPAHQPATAPAPPVASFDPFAGFNAAAPAAQPQPMAAAPPPYTYGTSSSFGNPAAAAAAAGGMYGNPGMAAPQPPAMVPPPQSMAAHAASPFGDHLFGGANAFGSPSPQEAAAVPPPFNPFSNPATHATVAPHMPAAPANPGAAATSAFAQPPPQGHIYAQQQQQQMNVFPPQPAPVPPPQTPAASQTPAPPVYNMSMAPQQQLQQPAASAFANPFGSPGGPPPQPANPFGSPGGGGGAPSPSNPFGGPTGGAPVPAASNPFGAAPGAGAWGQAAPQVTHQVGGYNLKKQADPLMDLSVDLFGKSQVPVPQQPMRPNAGPGVPQNGGGSPGSFF